MDNKYLISKEDVKLIRPTADLDDARIEPFILEAQKQQLKPLLNDALFYDFIKNFDNDSASYNKYRDLLNGKEWTYRGQPIYFEGIKAFLVYHTLAKFVVSNPINLTRFGVVKKTNNFSEPVTPQEIKFFIDDMKGGASKEENDIIKFLTENRTTYTLYDYNGSNDAGNRTGFNFFKL